MTGTNSNDTFWVRLMELNLPSNLYKDLNPRIRKVMKIDSNSIGYFKLKTTLLLTNSPNSWHQTIESYGKLQPGDQGSFVLKFSEWIQFNVSFSNLTRYSYLSIDLIDEIESYKIFDNHYSASDLKKINLSKLNGIKEHVCAHFHINIFDKISGKMISNPVCSYSGILRKQPFALTKLNGIKMPWLDMHLFKYINQKKRNLANRSEFNALLDELSNKDSIEKSKGVYIFYIQFSPYKHLNLKTLNSNDDFYPDLVDESSLKSNPSNSETYFNRSTPVIKSLNEKDNFNPCERMITRGNPSKEDLIKINNIIKQTVLYPLEEHQRTLLWGFRNYLKKHEPKSLFKLLESVIWEGDSINEAVNIMKNWKLPDWEPEEYLVLLSKRFNQPEVRKFCVEILSKKYGDDDKRLRQILLQLVQALRYEKSSKDSDLAKLLIKMSCKSFSFANYFFWYLYVEEGNAFKNVLDLLISTLKKNQPNFMEIIDRQQKLVKILEDIALKLQKKSKIEEKKIEVKNLLKNPDLLSKLEINSSNPLPLPVNPDIKIIGILADKANVFSSNASPIFLPFQTETGVYEVIFKTGDDLRQDETILQIISFIDRVTSKSNFKAGLIPYNVLATGKISGFVEFVPESKTLGELSNDKIEIQDYLKSYSKDSKEYNEFQMNYLNSLGGYTIISHLLGFGDRHPYNILIQKEGRLFHIDFAFIFGDIPTVWGIMPHPAKVFSGSIKLSPYMISGIGGRDSDLHKRFLEFSKHYFIELRKHAHAIINLFYLMIDAGINGISGSSQNQHPEQRILYVVNNFYFSLEDLDDSVEAGENIINAINKAEEALGGRIEDMSYEFSKKFFLK